MSNTNIFMDREKVVYAIIQSGAFKPHSTSAAGVAAEMARYAFLVRNAVQAQLEQNQAELEKENENR
jgi:hypothetical protein